MSRFGLTKLLFFNKTTAVFDRIMLRFYEQIISGMWSLSVLILIERFLQCKLLHDCNINYFGLWMFLLTSSLLLFCSAIAVPKIRQKKVRLEIKSLLREHKIINRSQEREILEIVRDALACKDLFSKEGFWQFVMSNLFNFGIVSFYFGVESLINIMFANTSHWIISTMFISTFISCITLESLLDTIFTRKFLYPTDNNNNDDQPKKLITSIMSIMSRDSLSTSINNIIFEDVIDDILAIMSVHSRAKSEHNAANIL